MQRTITSCKTCVDFYKRLALPKSLDRHATSHDSAPPQITTSSEDIAVRLQTRIIGVYPERNELLLGTLAATCDNRTCHSSLGFAASHAL